MLQATLARAGALPTATLLERAGVPPDEGTKEVERLVAAGQLLAIGKSVVLPGHWQDLQARALSELAPVSYTHLDVYKRQERCVRGLL